VTHGACTADTDFFDLHVFLLSSLAARNRASPDFIRRKQ
jgi:hypothetical protein